MKHIPVLLNESLNSLKIKDNGLYLDCTFGQGGHSKQILNTNKTCKVIAIDRDINSIEQAKKIKKDFKDRFVFINCCFSDIFDFDIKQLIIDGKINKDLLKIEIVKKEYLEFFRINDSSNIKKYIEKSFLDSDFKFKKQVLNNLNNKIELNIFDGILMDLGVSSIQIDDEKNGFSYMKNCFLDMRMGFNNYNAIDVINNYNKKDLYRIIRKYGEEKNTNKIVNSILKERNEIVANTSYKKKKKFKRISLNLNNYFNFSMKKKEDINLDISKKRLNSNYIKKLNNDNQDQHIQNKIKTTHQLVNIIKKSTFKKKDCIKSCARVFQAIRIHVNNEIGELIYFLYNVNILLKKNSSLSVITFHSIEDKIVKQFFKYSYLPVLKETYTQSNFSLILKENGRLEDNIRARSSTLRSGIKV